MVFVFLLFTCAGASAQGTRPAPAGQTASLAAASQPDEPYRLPPAKLAQAKVLGRVWTLLHFAGELWQPVFLGLLLAMGGAARLSRWCMARTRRSWLQAAIFSAALAASIFLVVEVPAATVGHAFTLHYGISVGGWLPWLLDLGKSFGLTVLIETPLLMLAFGLLRWSPRRYWLWFAAASVPLMIVATFLLPEVVEPLFYQFEPLAASHPELVRQLQQVVIRTGTDIPADRMFLMKASEKSNGLNAYVTGIGASKRIVVWDTTADRMPADEILFTFAHETGHYVLRHIPKGLALASAGLFVFFFLVARLAEWLVRRYGRAWGADGLASLPGLAVVVLAFSLVQIAAEPVANALSRHFEHEADVYGQEAIHGLVPDPQKTAVASFQRLGEVYLDDPDPNPFVAFWMYDHPSIQSRARFAEHYDPWVSGQRPRFFGR